jgi:glycosyltransferase involved in cell wall biosynthesis
MTTPPTEPAFNHAPEERSRKVLFLFPEILRPQKLNHAHMFELLSASLHGDVYTMASQAHKGAQIAGFRLYSGRLRPVRLLNWLVRLYVQLLLPIRLSIKPPRFDAIVTYDPYGSGVPALVLKWILRTKLIVQVMGDYHRLRPEDELVGEYNQLRPTGGNFKKTLMNLALRISLRSADAIKVLNRDQERFVRNNWPGKPVFRFADFAATRYFSSLDSNQGNYLLAVGHPFHRKGVDVLIRAFARIADDFPGISLRILGYAPQGELESYRTLGGHHPRIEFVKAGWIEEVGEQMRGCYGLVHAARSEAMGRVLLEAMACRKPIVSTKTNGGLDYILDGETGILCAIDNVEALASAMRILLVDPARAQRMGHAGYDHLQRTCSEERFSELFISMVEEVAGPASRS